MTDVALFTGLILALLLTTADWEGPEMAKIPTHVYVKKPNTAMFSRATTEAAVTKD